MDFGELKQVSKTKVLFRGKSAVGKTKTSCEIVVMLLKEDLDILYADTESEGASTIVNIIEDKDIDRDIVENLDYKQVDNYEQLMEVLENQSEYDVVVIDTLDHKHSYVLKGVTDARTAADADWNQYPQIYSGEKNVMEKIGKPDANIIATIDPDSGKVDKPKGAQTNVHGYFSVVIDLSKSGGEWTNKVTNWVGRGDIIGASVDNLEEALANDISERVE